MKLLITGFEPFGKHDANVSWDVARALAAQSWAGIDVEAARLPVSYDGAWCRLRPLLEHGCFDAVVMLGLAASRTEVCFERVAINVDDARLADNDGDCRSDRHIKEAAPAAYFSTWPIWQCWGVFLAICFVSMTVMFCMVKWLEKVTK